MCRPTLNTPDASSEPLLLLSLKSYETVTAGGKKNPSRASCAVTSSLMIAFLVAMEMSMRALLLHIQDYHSILEDETNRHILARHLGVDAVGCFLCAVLGWQSRHILADLAKAAMGDPKAMSPAGHEARLFQSHPAGFRIALFFFSYQVKNLYDTIVWNDGPEFIFHHLASMTASYGAMFPGFAHFYGIFFLGLSEVSTAVLCILANFDDVHGVKGMGDAFPLTKIIVGFLFVVLFIICRTIIWPIASYYFVRDSRLALQGDSAEAKAQRNWIRAFVICLSGLSVLQVAWLYEIYVHAKEEVEKFGMI